MVAHIRRSGVTEEELGCAKLALLAGHIYNGSDQWRLTRRYGRALAIGLTLEDVENWPAAISKVTAEEVKKAASTYLIDRRAVTGWLVPEQRGRRSPIPERAHSS